MYITSAVTAATAANPIACMLVSRYEATALVLCARLQMLVALSNRYCQCASHSAGVTLLVYCCHTCYLLLSPMVDVDNAQC
jgi:hypothetical protein